MRRLTSSFLTASLIAATVAACGPGDDDTSACSGILPGTLVISEVQADYGAPPDSSGADDGHEWFEIYNSSSQPVELTGLMITHGKADDPTPETHVMTAVTIDAGGYLVLGNALPGFLPAHVDYGYGTDLGDFFNTGTASITLQCGTTVVDKASYTDVDSGHSRVLDGDAPPDSQANDDQASWCNAGDDAQYEYELANFGTPGAANQSCMNITPGQCMDGATMRPTVAPAIGDLTITEVMPDPSAAGDAVGEWVEVLVNRDLDLNGVGVAAGTGNPVVQTSPDCLHVTAGSYLVFARNPDMAMNGGLPRVDGTTPSLTNSNGSVRVTLGATDLDVMAWTSVRAGHSLQLDDSFTTPADNDVAANLCDGNATYGAGDFGSPGAANRDCGSGPITGMCMDGATMRPTVEPTAGDLTITEVMPDPSAASDALGEWIEVRANRAVDLNGVGIAGAAGTPIVVSSPDCVHVAAGGYAVFAKTADMTMNGGLPRVDGTVVSLTNSNGTVRVLFGAAELDAMTWPSARAGHSIQLDDSFTAPADNDVAANLCDGNAVYGAGDFGTPGAGNRDCGAAPVGGMCMDGAALRPIVKPTAGQLVINEWMADPSLVADTAGEWFELRATAAVDLNGLQVGTTTLGTTPVIPASGPCVRVAAGGFALVARNATASANGMLPAVDAVTTITLANSNGTLQIGIDGAPLSTVTWTSTMAGKSIQVDGDGTQCNAPTGTGLYNGTDTGTPRAAHTLECP